MEDHRGNSSSEYHDFSSTHTTACLSTPPRARTHSRSVLTPHTLQTLSSGMIYFHFHFVLLSLSYSNMPQFYVVFQVV